MGSGVNCAGCVHFLPGLEECHELQGQVHCPECDRTWKLSERIGCPRCAEWKNFVDLAECPGGVPSVGCPGYKKKPVLKEQKGLF